MQYLGAHIGQARWVSTFYEFNSPRSCLLTSRRHTQARRAHRLRRWHLPSHAECRSRRADLFEVYSGRPLYRASDIHLPTLIVRGDHDRTSTQSDARGLFETLESERKLYCVVGRGAHFMVSERCLPALHSIVAGFLLDESLS